MKTNNYGYEQLDERQLILKNKFGFQAFVLLSVLVFGYAILKQFGTSPLTHLDSAFIIVFIAVGYYQIRTTLSGVYRRRELFPSIWCYAFIAVMTITDFFPFYSVKTFSRGIWSVFMFIYSLTISILLFITWRKAKKSEKNLEE